MWAQFLFEAIEGPVRLKGKVWVFLELRHGETFIWIPRIIPQLSIPGKEMTGAPKLTS